MQQNYKPICVVIDTNTWISDSNLLLKTSLGEALLYNLELINGYIGLPEIIEDEVIKHTIRVGQEAIQQINSNFKKIEILMGSKSTYYLNKISANLLGNRKRKGTLFTGLFIILTRKTPIISRILNIYRLSNWWLIYWRKIGELLKLWQKFKIY